jgi:hypothetical protein
MSVRYVLAPQAAIDLVEIWRYILHRPLVGDMPVAVQKRESLAD